MEILKIIGGVVIAAVFLYFFVRRMARPDHLHMGDGWENNNN